MKRLIRRVMDIALAEQGGANIYIILAISFGLLLITPFFLNSVSLFITRRTSVTAADSASLAAAESIAEFLTYGNYPRTSQWVIPIPDCLQDVSEGDEGPLAWRCTMAWYLIEYHKALGDYGISIGAAEAFAARNHAPLKPETYQVATANGTSPYFLAGRAGWQDFPAIAVSLQTERDYVPAASGYGGDSLKVPAAATAEIYLDSAQDYRHVYFRYPVDCGDWICWREVIYYSFDFLWKIRLKQYQGD